VLPIISEAQRHGAATLRDIALNARSSCLHGPRWSLVRDDGEKDAGEGMMMVTFLLVMAVVLTAFEAAEFGSLMLVAAIALAYRAVGRDWR
jgi:hypothetical protein